MEASMSGWLPTSLASMLHEHDFWPALVLLQLDARAALDFSVCCRRARELGVRTVACAVTEGSRTWNGPRQQYSALKWQDLILHAEPDRVHSVIVSCLWHDQGWGNQKGMLSIVQGRGRAPNDYSEWGPDVVVGTEPAPHEKTSLVLKFRPIKTDDGSPASYSVWVRIGGGGGHSLEIEGLKVQQVVFPAPATDC